MTQPASEVVFTFMSVKYFVRSQSSWFYLAKVNISAILSENLLDSQGCDGVDLRHLKKFQLSVPEHPIMGLGWDVCFFQSMPQLSPSWRHFKNITKQTKRTSEHTQSVCLLLQTCWAFQIFRDKNCSWLIFL